MIFSGRLRLVQRSNLELPVVVRFTGEGFLGFIFDL
jgi:hypothetical protein